MIIYRDQALTNYKRTKSLQDYATYKHLRNMICGAVRREKAAYLQYQFNNPDKKVFWKTVKQMNIKQGDINDIPNYLKNVQEINNYFLSIFNNEQMDHNKIEYSHSNSFNGALNFSLKMTTVEQVKDIICGEVGLDGVSANMLQYCSSVICPHITHIINLLSESMEIFSCHTPAHKQQTREL